MATPAHDQGGQITLVCSWSWAPGYCSAQADVWREKRWARETVSRFFWVFGFKVIPYVSNQFTGNHVRKCNKSYYLHTGACQGGSSLTCLQRLHVCVRRIQLYGTILPAKIAIFKFWDRRYLKNLEHLFTLMKTKNLRNFTKNIWFFRISKILEKVFVKIVNFTILKKFFNCEGKCQIIKNWQLN